MPCPRWRGPGAGPSRQDVCDGQLGRAGPAARRPHGVRYRLTRWLRDGKRVVLVSDEGGEDHLEVHHLDGSTPPKVLQRPGPGPPAGDRVSPTKDEIALSNHRHELIHIDLETGAATTIEQSQLRSDRRL